MEGDQGESIAAHKDPKIISAEGTAFRRFPFFEV